ncbi:MAG: hypothetical protein FJ297_00160 [Planctomycetes bacterium]|nr:hypothetical protein [Planctomycetota bacterium]
MRSALEKVPEITDIQTDLGTQICSFKLADAKFEIKGKLTELAGNNEHFAGWSMID